MTPHKAEEHPILVKVLANLMNILMWAGFRREKVNDRADAMSPND